MTLGALALVLASTITHAWWNFLLKRAGGSQMFVGLSKACEVVLLAPFLVWVTLDHPAPVNGVWTLVVVGAALVLLNYAALAKAYSTGNLSVVYPVSRGGVLLVLSHACAQRLRGTFTPSSRAVNTIRSSPSSIALPS